MADAYRLNVDFEAIPNLPDLMGDAIMKMKPPGGPGWMVNGATIAVILAALALGVIAIVAAEGLVRWAAAALTAVMVAAGFLLAELDRRALPRMVTENQVYRERQELTLSPRGITSRSENVDARISWAVVNAVEPLDRGFAIYYAGHFLVVPDDALPDGVIRSAVIADIEAWRAAPRGQNPVRPWVSG